MKARVLIVGTVPYNKKSTSRAFETYFCNWEKENLAQVFSNTKKPCKGHCQTLFQITDQRLILKRLNNRTVTGLIYNYDELNDEWNDNTLEVKSSLFKRLYAWGSKKRPITYLVRKWVWNKKLWCTDSFNSWLDQFNPECVFLSFSDDFFIPQIALYIAHRYNIPIVSSIGDDYCFNTHFSLSPFYYLYKKSYRKLIRKVFTHKGNAIYIGNKIRDKYNSEFGLDGETVYLTSTIERREFKEFNVENPRFTYCGNIRLGRNNSLDDIGRALGKINENYILDVYSNESDEKFFKLLEGNRNVKYHGSVPYAEVQRVIKESDVAVVVEGFNKKDVGITRYSLSTKVADALASGANVFAYGSIECGAIKYLRETSCATVCAGFDELVPKIENLLYDIELQRGNYMRAKKVSEKNHSIEHSTSVFEDIIEKVSKR